MTIGGEIFFIFEAYDKEGGVKFNCSNICVVVL